MNFEEVREHISGDDIRSIDWNVTARMNTPYVKKFTEERELTVMLARGCQCLRNVWQHRIEQARSLPRRSRRSLLSSAINNQDKVGLLLFSEEVELFIAPKKGRLHTLRLIREMLYLPTRGRRNQSALRPLSISNKLISRRRGGVCDL